MTLMRKVLVDIFLPFPGCLASILHPENMFAEVAEFVIVISRLLKRYLKAKRTRAPAYP